MLYELRSGMRLHLRTLNARQFYSVALLAEKGAGR